MSLFAQVWHVARKDLRRARWLLLSYVALIVIASVRASGVLPSDYDELALATPLLIMVALVLVAQFVQEDSPTRADAYWMTVPLNVHAMLGAKALLILLVALPAIVAQGFLLLYLSAPPSRVPQLLLHSGVVLLAWLLAAGLLGSVTHDLKGLVLATVTGLLAFLMLAVTTLMGAPVAMLSTRGLGLQAMGVAMVVAVLQLLAVYRSRDVGRVAWLGTAIAVTLLVAASNVSSERDLRASERDRRAQKPVPFPTVSRPGALTVTADSVHAGPEGVRVQVSVHSSLPDSVQRFVVSNVAVDLREIGTTEQTYTVVDSAVMALQTRGGSGFSRSSSASSFSAIPPAPPGTQWTSLPKSLPLPRAGKTVTVSAQAWRSLRDGRMRIPVSADVAELRADAGETLPRPGSGWSDVGGHRLRVERVPSTTVPFRLAVAWMEQGAPYQEEHGQSLRTFALVNDSLRETRVLSFAGWGWDSKFLILPASQLYTRTEELVIASGVTSVEDLRVQPSPAWLRGARVILFRWNTVRQFRADLGPAIVRTR